MNENCTISVATAEDALAISRLNLLFNEVDESPQAIAARMSDPACVETVILAKIADEAVGFALMRVVSRILYSTPHAELTELYVLEEFRQQGVASDLIAFAEKVAAQKGALSIIVQTGDDNLPALALYKRLEYEEYDLVLKKRIF
ncbi:MAG: GNAT family N-acetyltransferase [Anaerolineales bacterium]|uniref:GNAT family N-acetyltransferase n=1 Tax=Candidatus Villigracilis vicinus TaxID=3140679 RepID=UPI0031346A9F|nr:GNAT family N-acetyltransferase [Anaerolineales bacterium]